ncbi:hypothetical protein V5799_030557 [Amblyomma americanum]|uniref:Uncharacterized protein n=1 Tax=Amblyomma americanum TaxID=6943 RepID=A0AAQ4EMX3_AMBAM
MGLKYPDDEARRSLYATWLRVVGSNEWHDSFDRLMLECVAATPSPTTPEKPLFSNMYTVRHPNDGPIPDIWAPVLNIDRVHDLFAREREPVEPLPTSPGLVDYLAELIRASVTSRAALDEAGLIIGFCSLAMAVVVTRPLMEVRDFFSRRFKNALLAVVPTSFNGDMIIPTDQFLCEISKCRANRSLIRPFLVYLVLGQYAYHTNVEACPSGDINFLKEGFLNRSKYSYLGVIELLHALQEKAGIGAKELNLLIQSRHRTLPALQSSIAVAHFLEIAEGPMTTPWCRGLSTDIYPPLDVLFHLDYAAKLTALLAPDRNHELWQRREFAWLSPSKVKEALRWAERFRRFVRRRINAESARLGDS